MPTLKDRVSDLARRKDGEVVFGEAPNLPVIVALVASVLSFTVVLVRPIGLFFIVVASGAWFTWAWLELFDGSTLLRRIMGGVAMVGLVAIAYAGLVIFVVR